MVPARNEERHLESCLRSIDSQSEDEFGISIIVVDNESSDATVAIAERCGATVVQVAPGKPGRARNVGALDVGSDYLAFIDADCVLPDGWLKRAMEHLSDRRVAGVGSVQAIAPPDAPWVERAWVKAITPRSKTPWEAADWLAAFNLLVRRADFVSIGGFDETLTTCEDSDLSFRLAQLGELRRDFLCPVRHLGESQSLPEFFRREMWRSRGNFRSAWSRRSVRGELPSLLLPFVFLLLSMLALLTLVVALVSGVWGWWVIAAALSIAVLGIPMTIAAIKCGRDQFGQTSVLIAVYLMARSLGPLIPAKRVSRS